MTWSLQGNSTSSSTLGVWLWALYFCIIYRDVFVVSFFHLFLKDVDLHLGSMLASFSMFFALLVRASILHGFVINCAMIFKVFSLISIVQHPIGETLKNTGVYVIFA